MAGPHRQIARAVCQLVRDRAARGPARRSDHRILYRLDVRSPEGVGRAAGAVRHADPGDAAPLVSHEDHTPARASTPTGAYYERYVVGQPGA